MASILRSSPSGFVCPLTLAVRVKPHAVLGYGEGNFSLGRNGRKSHGTKEVRIPKKLIKNCGAVGLSVTNPRITSKERNVCLRNFLSVWSYYRVF